MKSKLIFAIVFLFAHFNVLGQVAASYNYSTQTGTLGTTYSWIDCSSGVNIVSGDDTQANILWPFPFNFYDNTYTTSNNLSVATNGFIRLDGVAAGGDYTAASNYNLTSSATTFGQILALGIHDCQLGRTPASWVRSLVTGIAPNRIFTIEYNDMEIDYDDYKYADVQVSFFETTNKIVIKFGADDVIQTGADIGIHSGVVNYFHKWQEVASGTNSTWIEYSPPDIEVNATINSTLAHYTTLKRAFDKINDGTHQGIITIKINSSTTESASAVLNSSGTGSSIYSSILIYPTETGLSINGNLATPLIDLNGADNVTIDGRVNAEGAVKDLSIINSSNSSVAGTSTIRFINGATNNTLKYTTVKGSEINTTSGILFFSTTTAAIGNNTNIVEHNDITNAINANRPVNAIFSLGTAGKDNSGNIISNNNIFDFVKHGTASNGISLSTNTTDWTIYGNSFYETTTFVPTANVLYVPILISYTAGSNFNISNNYIGGSSPFCGGTPWTKTNARNNTFAAISLNVSTTTASSVQNNTIQNFSWSNSSNGRWRAIEILGGNANIGNIVGNTIGAVTGTGSITVNGTTTGQIIDGIYFSGTGEVICQNNTIGSVTVNNGATLAGSFYGINKTASAGNTTISHNYIGSTVTANSIYASSTSTSNVQVVYGIYCAGTGNNVISNNTISKLTNGTTNTNTGTLGLINGITSINGINTISNNIVYDLTISNRNTNATSSASVCGLAITGTAYAKIVKGNTIYNLSNTNDLFAGNVIGVYFAGGTSANDVSENFIHSLSVTGATSTAAIIYGIKIATGVTTYSNNIISLGGNTRTDIYGIYETGASNNNNSLYFNTIYIGGNLASGSTNKSYAIWSNASTNVRNFRNNIFMNARSTTSGTNLHYAAYFNYTASTNITLNYNDYFVSGTGGVMGWWNSSNKTSLPIITGQDVNSLNTNPGFTTPGGTNSLDYEISASLSGVSGTGITTDFQGITRNDPPKMGAMESALDFIWQGNTNSDFATAANWQYGVVPLDGADISFASTPANDCYLDQNRSLKNITNTSGKKFVINGNQLTLTGDVISATANQIDATAASSVVIFEGTNAQSIPAGIFVANTINALTLNNSNGLTQNGDIIITTTITLTTGAYNIGANILTINGAIVTTSGTLIGGSTSDIVFGGSGAGTTLPSISVNNLTLNRANGISLGGSVSIGGTLALISGSLTVGANTLTISGNSPTKVSGNINAGDASSTLNFNNSSAIILPSSIITGNINNLTINGAGITAGSDLTVNGILYLQSTNPSAFKGCLDMSIYTLKMEGASTTTGYGDVTGIVKREHTFLQNVPYTFGSEHTTFTFTDANLKPTWISLKITIGEVPSWSPWMPSPDGKVKRLYQVACSENSSTSEATINMRYLLSELDATFNEESKLVFWHKFIHHASGDPHEHGKANQDFINHFIGVIGMPLGSVTTSDLEDSQVGLAYSLSIKNTWKGEISGQETKWEQPNNWSYSRVPLSTDDVLIPGGLSYYPSLTASSNSIAKSIEIEAGGSISANTYTITVTGSAGAWSNQGTFLPGTGKVLFDHGVLNEIVTVAGITNFYDIEVGANTSMQPVSGCILRIAGTGSADMTSVIDFSSINNTVEWNGGDQNIVDPNGIGGNGGYYKLILSGTGTKTMPITALNIADEFQLSGSVTATAQSPLTIGMEFEILEGATFATGDYDHTVGGPFDNRGTFIASAGTNIILNGTSVQNIYGGSPTAFEKLTINNPAGVVIITDVTVNDELILTNGNLNVGTTTLTINGAITKTSGFINTVATSSLIFGGTTALTLPANLFLTSPSINNLTINRTGGVIAGSDITVNGILNIQTTNPSSTIGGFSTGAYTLIMGATATTIGQGEVTGKIKRTTILPDTEYTFGTQYSSVTFSNIGTLPSEITLKVSIGSAPTWKQDGIKRIYDISQIGASATNAVLKSHYLDSELNGLDEEGLGFFSYIFPSATLLDRGHSERNTTDNWITLSNADFGNLPSAFGVIEHGFAVSVSDVITWDGSVSTDWYEASNWMPAYAPSAEKHVIIPDGATTPNDPLITASTSSTILSIEIKAGAVLNAGAGSQLTIVGSTGAWQNYGTFNASTGKVLFNHGVPEVIVNIAGTTNFYDIEVGENTIFQPVAGCMLRISGVGSASATSVVDFHAIQNTVEWNGTNQTIVNPIGIGGHSGYYNLIISGSGTKTMPTSEMTIHGDFTVDGTAVVTAAETLIILGDMTIESGSTFETGILPHFLGGDLINNGTFTGTAGGTYTFNGANSQIISGTSAISFDNLTIDNSLNVTQVTNIEVNNVLSLDNGYLIVGNSTLNLNGTISNPSGAIEVSSGSNLSFGGTSALTINDNLFNENPSFNNLIINRSGGVTLGNQGLNVGGTLTLTSGTLTLSANTLTLSGNSPSRVSGNIYAGDISAEMIFANTSPITLPADLFSGSITNFKVNGIGGVTSNGNLVITGVLNLVSPNPSAYKGSLDMSTNILNMGGLATTEGIGDVSGIIRRSSITSGTEYTFGNQYTTIFFPNVGTLPTEISLKVKLGSSPSWRNGAINRIYDFIQTGGNGTQALLRSHYLDSELNGNDENKLVDFVHVFSGSMTIEYGRSAYNVYENWVSISNVNVGVFSSNFGVKEVTMDEYSNLNLTWNGSTSSSWVTAENWTPAGAPSDVTTVTIPNAATTDYDPTIYSIAICNNIIIESGGILNLNPNSVLTIKGADNAWVNNGVLNPGTGTINFAHGIENEPVTISGTTDFYNLTIEENTLFQPATGSITRIAGTLSYDINSSIIDCSTNFNTIEYNGNQEQTIINPGGSYGYHHLILSGSGDKLLPGFSLNILGDLSIYSNISASGNTIFMGGTSAQSINGNVDAIFDNITIDNASGVTLRNTALSTISGNLLINNGKIFEIEAAQKLEVTGSIINNAGSSGFVLNSDATGTAELLHDLSDVPGTAMCYFEGPAESWHFISSPVSNQSISGTWLPSGTYGNGTGYDLYLWNEFNSCWIYKLNTSSTINWNTVHPGSNFEVGRGYLYSFQESQPTKEFVGNLNNGTKNISLSYASESEILKGFNLVGNPYPSSIDWKASTGWTRTNLKSSGGGYNIWIWNPVANNYGVYNSADNDDTGTNSVSRYIGPSQGFFVQANNAGDLSMTNAVRILRGESNFFNIGPIDETKLSIRINSESGSGSDEVKLKFGYLENEKGALKLFSNYENAPSLYIPYYSDNLSVLNLTSTNNNPVVPIDFIPGTNDNYTLTCDFDLNSFEVILLEDCKTSNIQDMKTNQTYSFKAEKSDDRNRFKLHFGNIEEDFGENLPVKVYPNGNQLILDLLLVKNDAEVTVCDIMGRVLLRDNYLGQMQYSITLNAENQILIINIENGNGSFTKKLFWAN